MDDVEDRSSPVCRRFKSGCYILRVFGQFLVFSRIDYVAGIRRVADPSLRTEQAEVFGLLAQRVADVVFQFGAMDEDRLVSAIIDQPIEQSSRTARTPDAARRRHLFGRLGNRTGSNVATAFFLLLFNVAEQLPLLLPIGQVRCDRHGPGHVETAERQTMEKSLIQVFECDRIAGHIAGKRNAALLQVLGADARISEKLGRIDGRTATLGNIDERAF